MDVTSFDFDGPNCFIDTETRAQVAATIHTTLNRLGQALAFPILTTPTETTLRKNQLLSTVAIISVASANIGLVVAGIVASSTALLTAAAITPAGLFAAQTFSKKYFTKQLKRAKNPEYDLLPELTDVTSHADSPCVAFRLTVGNHSKLLLTTAVDDQGNLFCTCTSFPEIALAVNLLLQNESSDALSLAAVNIQLALEKSATYNSTLAKNMDKHISPA